VETAGEKVAVAAAGVGWGGGVAVESDGGEGEGGIAVTPPLVAVDVTSVMEIGKW
jgi:hypothetical protein